MIKSLVLVTTFLTLTVACSKKDAPVKLSKEFLLGKWNYTFSSLKQTENNVVKIDTIYKNLTGSYNDFRANDTVYSLFMGKYDTSHYSIGKDITGDGDQITFAHKSDSKIDKQGVMQISKNQITLQANVVVQGLPPTPTIGRETKNILSR